MRIVCSLLSAANTGAGEAWKCGSMMPDYYESDVSHDGPSVSGEATGALHYSRLTELRVALRSTQPCRVSRQRSKPKRVCVVWG